MDTETSNPWVGDGSIKQFESGRHKGKWRLQWTILAGPDRVPQKVDKQFHFKRDAEKWRDQKKLELRTGANVDAAKSKAKAYLTVQDMWNELAGTRARISRTESSSGTATRPKRCS